MFYSAPFQRYYVLLVFQCLVNDKWFCDFAHRGDISEVHGVHIEGDVSLAEVVYFDGLVSKTNLGGVMFINCQNAEVR